MRNSRQIQKTLSDGKVKICLLQQQLYPLSHCPTTALDSEGTPSHVTLQSSESGWCRFHEGMWVIFKVFPSQRVNRCADSSVPVTITFV